MLSSFTILLLSTTSIVLCGKVLNFNQVINTVVKIINSVKAPSMQYRLFKVLLEDEGAYYTDVVLHTEVKWHVLARFISVLEERKLFLNSRKQSWIMMSLEFLTDIMLKLNELNLQLQGKDHLIAKMISAVNAFKCKLESWKVNLARKSLSYFPYLNMTMSMGEVNLNTLKISKKNSMKDSKTFLSWNQ